MATSRGHHATTVAALLLALAALFALALPGAALAEDRDPGGDTGPEDRLVGGFIRPEPLPDEQGGSRGLTGQPPREDGGDEEGDTARRGNDGDAEEPRGERLELSVPKLGLKDVEVGDSADQSYLDREGIMHLSGTDFPWEGAPSNTYIAGHAIGYAGSRVPEAFRDLEDLREGDLVTLRDTTGKSYRYRVYERLVVDPSDFWVTEPVEGKGDIVSLQTCWPEPSFEERLIVRAQKVGSDPTDDRDGPRRGIGG